MHKCQLVHQPFAKSFLGYKKLRQRMFGLNCKAASVRGYHFNSFQIIPVVYSMFLEGEGRNESLLYLHHFFILSPILILI